MHSLFKNGKIPRIIIDGPYGSPSQGLYDFDTVLCCGTGIGITPFASFLRSVIHRSKTNQMENKKIYFVWIANQIQCFEWFDDLLGKVERDAPCVRPQIYLTMSNLDTDMAHVSFYLTPACASALFWPNRFCPIIEVETSV